MDLFAPIINDVTTDLDDPPTFPSGRHGSYPEGNRAPMRRHYSDLVTLRTSRAVEEAWQAVCQLAEQRWQLVHRDEGDHVLEAIDTTRLLRFKDDIVVRVREAGEQTAVDARSASRVGRGDLGKNANRLRAFFAQLRPMLG